MIRLKPDELETVAKHIPDAEDACERARTTLSWEPSSLAMDLPGVSTPAIEALRDELVHWLKRYEDKLNEAEELLYRTAAAMRQADQTLADNMREFGLELLGWYDVQRVFGEYDPITGERLSIGDRLLAGGMLLLSIVPPAKSAGVAGKAAIKGAKAIDAASALAKVKHVVRYDKMKAIGDIAFRQTVRSPLAETARLFKKQWDELVKSVASVSWQPAYAGVGPAPRVWMSEAKDASLNMIKKVEKEIVGKREGKTLLPEEGKVGTYEELIDAGRRGDNITPHHMPSAKYIKTKAGIHKNDGVSMNMEHPHPGVGGRHRKTATYGMIGQRLQEYLNLSPRAALAHDIWDARRIYKNDGLYTREIRQSLKDVIRMNKDMYPDLFNK
ncbi:pre-toxin TG domain-containing protein [Anoxybacteroides tepidamans]|uniref:pre-toxin TG domain-containing protein n=1 Tax=Anoxybacteroides tepidamans TaxID=265948 RepID=UPI000484656D|nr:pre-toxin TG domain-containing protein [Anoxybacillus tepidamans]